MKQKPSRGPSKDNSEWAEEIQFSSTGVSEQGTDAQDVTLRSGRELKQ